MRPSLSAIFVAALLLFGVACAGSSGGSSTPTPGGNGTGGGGSGQVAPDDDDDDTEASPGARLVNMVEEIVGKVEHAQGCDQFADALDSWTNRNKAAFETLVQEVRAGAGSATEEAAETEAKVVEGYLIVVEAAAECGENEAAMRAYEAFNETVEKATY